MAAKTGSADVVELLLADERVDPAAENNEAIRWAAKNGQIDVVELLLADERVHSRLSRQEIEKYSKL